MQFLHRVDRQVVEVLHALDRRFGAGDGREGGHAVQQRGALFDPALAHAVPGEDGLLLVGLDRHEALRGLAGGNGNGQ